MPTHRTALLVALALWGQACGQAVDLPVPAVPRSGSPRADLRALPHAEITLLRRGCAGACPVYRVTYRRDGTVTYQGERFVDFIGERSGRVDVADFVALAHFVQQSGFRGWDGVYRAGGDGLPSIGIAVTYTDGTSKTVRQSGLKGPPELWVLQRVLDGLMVQVRWQPDVLAAGGGGGAAVVP